MTAGNTGGLRAARTTREPTIAAGFARALTELAVKRGADRPALMRRSGIDAEALADHDNRIPLAKYIALMHAGQELAGDPALALHFGEAYAMTELTIVALLGHACETMADALAQMDRFGRLMVDIDVDDPAGRRLVFSREGDGLWLVDTRKNPNDFPEMTESSFARMASTSRRAAHGGPTLVREIHVTHKAPAYRDEYDRVFQVPVTFESDRNALLMVDESVLTMKMTNPVPRYAFGILSERAEALLKELDASTTVRGRVESLLVPILHTGDVSMDAIAAKMAVSRQTLFRKLKAEGVTFAGVLDELRHRLALDYLGGKKVSVNETAYLVGFSDPAAFSRAFKRWTGTSPKAMRAAKVEGGPANA
jgi:AraC-like DNA-binding protein